MKVSVKFFRSPTYKAEETRAERTVKLRGDGVAEERGFKDEWKTRGRGQGKKKGSIKKDPLSRSRRRLGRPMVGKVAEEKKRRRRREMGEAGV